MARARGRVKQQQRASFIGFASNKPHKFGKPQEIENSRGRRFLRNQEPVIKFSRVWRVEGKPQACWPRGTRTEKLGRKIQGGPGEGRDWRKFRQVDGLEKSSAGLKPELLILGGQAQLSPRQRAFSCLSLGQAPSGVSQGC